MALDIGAKYTITAGVAGQAAVDGLNRSLKTTADSAGGIAAQFGNLRGAIAGLGIAAVAATLTSMARAAVDNADAMNEMAERTGIAGSELSKLDYAAKMNGTTLENVEKALTKVSVKALDAATGNKAAAATFDALGISVLGLDGQLKSSDVLLQDVADVLSTVQDRTTRTALAVELFGRSGAELIPLMENMRDAKTEAERLGIVVGDDFQKSAAEFNDNIDRMGFLAKAFATDLANTVIPTLNRFMTELTAGKEIFGGWWEATKQIGTTNPFNTVAENAEKYRLKAAGLSKQIEELANGQNKWFGKDTVEGKARIAELNAELSTTQKLVEYFQRMNGQTSTAGAGRGSVNPPMVSGGGESLLEKLRKANEKASGAGKPGAAKESEFDKLLRQYQDQSLRVENLTEAEKLLREVQLGRYKDLTAEQVKTLEGIARELDYKKAMADGEKVMDEHRRKASTQRVNDEKRAQDEQDRAIEKWEELADPAKRYREEIEKVREAFSQGLINSDVAGKAVDSLNDQIEALNKVKDKGKDTFEELKDAVEGWGRQATDAFVDFAFTGKASFGDMASSILKDMAKMLVQKQLMGPLFNMIDGGAGGGGLGGIGSMVSSLFGFADGGVMTGSGPMPLRAYASGGVATGPQLALYGEGSMNEAFVPLPDGRSIPVTMQGGGGTSIVVNVNASGQSDAQGGGKLSQLGNAIAAAVQKELVNQKRPGGLLAA